jgi:DNA-binding NarL/FixJ family response regulator
VLNTGQRSPTVSPSALTPRQTACVRELVRDGATDREIAFRLGITRNGVAFHILHACQNAGVSGRTALALWAERSGLFQSNDK